MLLGIDHVIVAVADLERAATEVERELGLRVAAGGRHDAHGTHNRLCWLGDSYIELMGVFDERLAGESWWGRHALEVIGRGGGLMGVALASDDVAADGGRLRELGSSIGEPSAGERQRPDGDLVRWRIARLGEPHPEIGLLFLIEHDSDAAEWRPADRQARAAEVHPLGTPARLLRLEVPVADVRGTTQRLLRDLGLQFRPSLAGGGAREASVGPHGLRLRGGAGAPTIVVRGGLTDQEKTLLGCRWEIVAG